MEGLEQKSKKICFWKKTLIENLRGEGTSFEGRTRENLPCFDCDGTKVYAEKINCPNYTPSES